MPIYTDTTEATYALLPEHHRTSDAEQPAPLDQPLKRYLSTIGDQLDALTVLIDRLAFVNADANQSDLVDSVAADAQWIPWLAQLLGIETSGRTVPELRALIGAADFKTGTLGSLRAVLTSEYPAGVVARHFEGDPFALALVVGASAPSDPGWAAFLALAEADVPAGFKLDVVAVDGPSWAWLTATRHSWSDVTAAYATWADVLLDGP